MAAADPETAAALRGEVAALRMRVQELEAENQRLARIASTCTCGFKEGSVGSITAHHNVKFHQNSTMEKDLSSPFDHTVISNANEMQCNRNADDNGLPEDSSKHTKRTDSMVFLLKVTLNQQLSLRYLKHWKEQN